jgi:WD40-like Beta Propeller Repeat
VQSRADDRRRKLIIDWLGFLLSDTIAPDESYIIFAGTSLPESRGACDLYVSFRGDGVWTKPTNLGDKINSVGWDFSPKVSPDGKWFFFTSNRGFADKPLEKRLSYKELLQKLHSPGNGLRDIYKIDISALNSDSSFHRRNKTGIMRSCRLCAIRGSLFSSVG